MKLIKIRLYVYAGMAVGGVAACILIFIKSVISVQNPGILSILIIKMTILLAAFSVREYKSLKAARLIIENQILHIQPAVIGVKELGKETEISPGETIEFFISCFGILLDSRIIKFNQDGINLKAVEIGRNFISMTYGTDKKTQTTRLLHAEIDSGELVEIVEKFRYETGIVPTIAN